MENQLFNQKLKELEQLLRKWRRAIQANPTKLANEADKYRNVNELILLLKDNRQSQSDDTTTETVSLDENEINTALLESLGISLSNIPVPDVEKLRKECSDLLTEWGTLNIEVINRQSHYLLANYIYYGIATAGQKPLSNTKNVINGYIKGSISTIAGDVTKYYGAQVFGTSIKTGIIAAFTTAGATFSVPGVVVGFFIGVTVGVLVSEVENATFGPSSSKDVEAIRDFLHAFLDKKDRDLRKARKTDLSNLKEAVKSWSDELGMNKPPKARKRMSSSELIKIKAALKRNIAALKKLEKEFNRGNFPLGNRLLKHWVLENIGNDNNDPNDDYKISDAAWKSAVRKLKRADILDKTAEDETNLQIKEKLTASIIDERLAFLYQIRNELEHAGIRINSAFLQWENDVKKFKKIWEKYDQTPTSSLISKCNNKTFTFKNREIKDVSKFIKWAQYTYDLNPMKSRDMKYLMMRLLEEYRTGKAKLSLIFSLTITIEDARRSNTIVCTAYDYKLNISSEEKGHMSFSWGEWVD